MACTAVKMEEDQLVYRLYSVKRDAAAVQLALRGVDVVEMREMNGDVIQKVRPYQIAELVTRVSEKR
jgi:hypothetical protein